MARSLPGVRRNEHGQAMLLLVLAMTVIFVVGAITVDVGLWVSERYGARTDADFSALAGAQAYLDDLTDTNGAFNDAFDGAVHNQVIAADIDDSPTTSCSPGNSCIDVGTSNCRPEGDNMPWVESRVRHPTRSLFAGIFGVMEPDVGAFARACVGSPRTRYDLSPFGIQTSFVPANGDPEVDAQCDNDLDDDGDGNVNDGCPLSGCLEPDPDDSTRTRPVYGAVCILKAGSSDSVSGQRGTLTIGSTNCEQTSANTLRHDFHYGTNAGCTIGQEVNTGTGVIVGLLQGLNDRLLEEGRCDDLFNTGHTDYDDFDEVFAIPGADPGDAVVPSADNVFSENPCRVNCGPCAGDRDSSHVHSFNPRAVHLVLIDELQQGEQTAIITGFAGFYVIGCFNQSTIYQVKQDVEQDLTNFGAYLNRCESPTGQDDILGIFVKTLAPPENVGDPDANLPLSIVLVE